MSESYLKGHHRGLKRYRFKTNHNHEEYRFAKKWEEWCDRGHLEWLLSSNGEQALNLTERDAQVAATIIQWLGTPVGRGFLQELGYEKNVQKR